MKDNFKNDGEVKRLKECVLALRLFIPLDVNADIFLLVFIMSIIIKPLIKLFQKVHIIIHLISYKTNIINIQLTIFK